MRKNRFNKKVTYLTDADLRRRKRELGLILLIGAVLVGLTYLESRLIHFGPDFPISNTILMFILININLLLLLLLIFLVFRNLVKLLYDRRRRVMGAKLRTRLVVAFIGMTLLPTCILFFLSIHFITTSIEFWFNVPVEQALENSLQVGRSLYGYMESHQKFYLGRIAYQMDAKKYMASDKKEELKRYIRIVQREFNLQAIEVYNPEGKRILRAVGKSFREVPLKPLKVKTLMQKPEDGAIRAMSEATPYGELNRMIAAVPLSQTDTAASGYLVLSYLLPPQLTENLASISRGYEEYQQIKLLKQPIQATHYLTLSIVALLVLFCAVWLGFTLARSISIPIKELAEGTRRVAGGDLSVRIPMVGDDEIGSLVNSFNKMTRELRSSREQLELSAQMLKEQNVEIEARRQYMEIVLNNISTGVVSLDARGFITTVNKSAKRMLGIETDVIIRQSYTQVLTGQHLDVAREVMEKIEAGAENLVMPVRVNVNGRPRSFMTHYSVLKDEQGCYIGLVAVFDDLTEREKAQRMAAWREVARRIAHEVKNPLTPISLSAQRLKRKYSGAINEAVFDECTEMIIDQVELIRNLVNEFSRFARFPTADPKLCELLPIVEETLALYRESQPEIEVSLEASSPVPPLNLDRFQIKQALINLIENAMSAMRMKGKIAISMSHEPSIKTVRLEIADTGPGISDADKTRLFEPYFSTKKTGMGLGLTIVSTIIADHNGTIRVQDNHPAGARFIIELPV